jgi:2-oxoisovalerate dehydrogenase E1 component
MLPTNLLTKVPPDRATLAKAFTLMSMVQSMANTYEHNRTICKYVHSTSRGHEAIQIATGLQVLACDYISPYYRDESLMLAMGFSPYELMLQLLAKADDAFSGGRSYYNHPSVRQEGRPTIIHQSSATGMQSIPTTGIAMGLQYIENYLTEKIQDSSKRPVVLCSLGDNSMTEGEVSEALQMAALKQLPIIFLVQDNQWGISVTANEARSMNAYEFVQGFKGIAKVQVDGSKFDNCYHTMARAFNYVREERNPILVHATVPLLGHHTSGVRKEFYRSQEDLQKHSLSDPFSLLRTFLLENGFTDAELDTLTKNAEEEISKSFEKAVSAADPDPSIVTEHIFASTPIQLETGDRSPVSGEKIIMVDAAMHAIEEIMQEHPEAIVYGQDVGKRLGGVFRETATLGEKFGDHRVFNTAIQEAFIVGSTAGMSAVGLRPIVEVQFGDYIYPGINQLVCEVAKSCYLTMGKFPVSMILRVPVGAYGGGGPYHSGSVETTLLSIKGIKVCFPSNAADMKGLMKAAYYDPNPVVILEHKGLYWSKVPGTEEAKTIEPASDYILPLGKANIVLHADNQLTSPNPTACIVTYGMGVYWAKTAAQFFPGQIDIIDLRTLYPLDEALIFETVKKHGKCLVLTEEQKTNSFAEALAYRISTNCFKWLDAPVSVLGALDLPAVPINLQLESAMLPNAEKLRTELDLLLNW